MTADRILVTGATGYLGSALVRELTADGKQVVAMEGPRDSATIGTQPKQGIEVFRGDVTDERSVDEAMRGVTRVYHLAGIASPNFNLAQLIWHTNVIGSYNVARSALRHGVERVVHVSSTAAIGYPPDGVVADENFDPRRSVLDNVYASTKRASERLMLDFVDRDLDVVVINPAAVFAPGSGAGSPRSWQGLLAAAHRGVLRAAPPGGTAVCSARDFVEGATAAMVKGQTGERYILSTVNLTYRQIAELLVEAVGRQHRVLSAPMELIRAAGVANRLIRHVSGGADPDDALVRENIELMARQVYYSADKAVGQLGIPKVSTAELIAEFVR